MAIRDLIVRIVLAALLINIFTCAIYSFSADRNILIQPLRELSNPTEVIYLIGGAQCRTEHVFDFILSDLPSEASVYYVEYQNSGFDLTLATLTLRAHKEAHAPRHVPSATLISVSMGYQLSVATATPGDRQIALNPCPGYSSLKTEIQTAARFLPLAKAATFLTGWLAYLPLVKTSHGQPYSVKLLLDQFTVCTTDRNFNCYPPRADVIALSDHDEVLNNNFIATYAAYANKNVKLYALDTTHFGTTDNAALYRDLVLANLSD